MSIECLETTTTLESPSHLLSETSLDTEHDAACGKESLEECGKGMYRDVGELGLSENRLNPEKPNG